MYPIHTHIYIYEKGINGFSCLHYLKLENGKYKNVRRMCKITSNEQKCGRIRDETTLSMYVLGSIFSNTTTCGKSDS